MLASQAAGAAPRDARREYPGGSGGIKHGLFRREKPWFKNETLLGYKVSTVTPARPLARQPADLAPPKLCDGALPAAEILAHSGRTPLALVRPDASLASLAAAASLARKRDLPQVGGNGSTCPCVSSQSLRRPRTSRHAGTARNAQPSGWTCRWCSSRSRPRRRPRLLRVRTCRWCSSRSRPRRRPRLLRVPFPHRWQGKPCPHLVAARRECE